MTVTILTPTYNRGKQLTQLWASLNAQTERDFEWLVVDDGSADDTRALIERLSASSDFPIRYIHKENGGKHTALNLGISTISSELTMIVDSDDTVTKDCVAQILQIHQKYKRDASLCGYAFLRGFPGGEINGKAFDVNEKISNHIAERINGSDLMADKAEVFRTKCLREFPFPEFEGERFLSEDVVWIRMARKYGMVYVNRVVYVGEYQADGLTQNRRKHNIASPVGCVCRAKEFMKPDIRLRYRIKGALQYMVYGRFAGMRTGELIRDAQYKGLALACALPGEYLYGKWKRTMK